MASAMNGKHGDVNSRSLRWQEDAISNSLKVQSPPTAIHSYLFASACTSAEESLKF